MSKLDQTFVAINSANSVATTTMVVGATGATGSLLLEQLLHEGNHVRAIVRSPENLKDEVRRQGNDIALP